MRVLFDNGAFGETHGGVSRYYAELMKRLGGYGVSYVLPFEGTANRYLQEAPFGLKAQPDCEAENRARIEATIEAGDFDILHVTAPHLYGDLWGKVVGKKPIVITVHDLIPELLTPWYRWRYAAHVRKSRGAILKVADGIIAVSENTKRDLVRVYGVEPERIAVVYHGSEKVVSDQSLVVSRETNHQSLTTNHYLLFVGKKEGYKNWDWFVKAVRPLGIRVVSTEGRMSEEELAAAYRGAVAFVYPSRYEGFGIPILEAWRQGCPVVCSRIGSFTEVAGDAALYFDPEGAEGAAELRRCVTELKGNADLRAALVEKGYRRLERFSWETCARETAEVYRKVMEKWT